MSYFSWPPPQSGISHLCTNSRYSTSQILHSALVRWDSDPIQKYHGTERPIIGQTVRKTGDDNCRIKGPIRPDVYSVNNVKILPKFILFVVIHHNAFNFIHYPCSSHHRSTNLAKYTSISPPQNRSMQVRPPYCQ